MTPPAERRILSKAVIERSMSGNTPLYNLRIDDVATLVKVRLLEDDINDLVLTTPLMRVEVWQLLDALEWDPKMARSLIALTGNLGYGPKHLLDTLLKVKYAR